MKKINLTKGKEATVDDEDYEFLMHWKWCAVEKIAGFYAQRKQRVNGKQITYYMHREIMQVKGRNNLVDHKDHDTLNNKRENLRTCTASENRSNSRKRKNCISEYKGVVWYGKRKCWIAQIQKNNIHYQIGRYKKEIDAALAYNAKAVQLHGEFAYLNKIAI